MVDAHDAERAGFGAVDGFAGDRDIGLGRFVLGEHGGEIHAIELIAREDEHVLDAGLGDVRRFLRTASAVPWYQWRLSSSSSMVC